MATYAFLFSEDHGRTFRQMATGLSEDDMGAHVSRVVAANAGPHLRLSSGAEGTQLRDEAGPKDGSVWFWQIER